jgi:hypothetical protein
MPIPKEAGTLGMPWEQSYGYAQAVRVGDTIWVSRQLSHDNEGNIVGPAPVDAQGRIPDHGNSICQMSMGGPPAGGFGASIRQITMVSNSGGIKAQPSSLPSDGTSFSDTWVSSGP